MSGQTLTLLPAYGRDYKTSTSVIMSWVGGKDFEMVGVNKPDGTYCSIRDTASLKLHGFDQVKIRFNKQQDFELIALV